MYIEWFNNSTRVHYYIILCTCVWNCHCGGQATIFGPKWAILCLRYSRARSTVCSYYTRVISVCCIILCIGTCDVLQGQPCRCALGQAPLFSFLLFKQKTHNNNIFSTLPILTLNFFAGCLYLLYLRLLCVVIRSTVIRLDYYIIRLLHWKTETTPTT